jgi:hypothetical protein
MPKTHRFSSAACVAIIGALMLTPTAASAQALQSYVKIKGTKQGQFKGEGTKQGASSPKAATTSSSTIRRSASGGSRR